MQWSWRPLLVVLLVAPLGGCGTEADQAGSDGRPAQVAETYFKALAAADYDRMVEVSTGLAAVAARYGQQVLAADPDAFTPRDLEVTQPLVQREGEEVLDGALDLVTKGLDDRLRITEVAMVREGQAWVVADYRRDGRALDEVFRDVSVTVTGGGAQAVVDLVLTDDLGDVLLVPLVLTSGESPLTVLTDQTVAEVGSGQAALSVLEGEASVPASSERPLVLTFHDVDIPSTAASVRLVLAVENAGEAVVLELPLDG